MVLEELYINLPLPLSVGPEPITKPYPPRRLQSHSTKTTTMSSATPTHRLLPRLALKDKAAIGIGVPLGLILVLILGTMLWLNMQKRRHGPVTELDVDGTELEAQKKAAANPVNNAQIRWKPY
ncbi:uncharacterized protein BDZ99DRAFT_313492 [Mytilinidion resinicola]|uniref:Uncharacterized protein n=1 Tax=Mytilinidion resinicola TaxID=574789 RepID=A0A6A6YR95_9PEZI|nr:uncharacterized protein BDZ99DRAFT_313492 [Mytilinidion resinicola]KAF2810485.1 hypothetical protein BDZ99DRAFT_313492 [Mytilinidion resinicola]